MHASISIHARIPAGFLGRSEKEKTSYEKDGTCFLLSIIDGLILIARGRGALASLCANDDRILGFSMIGSEAGEVMAVVQTAMLADLPYPKLRDAILAHPTMAEGLGDLFANVPPRSGP